MEKGRKQSSIDYHFFLAEIQGATPARPLSADGKCLPHGLMTARPAERPRGQRLERRAKNALEGVPDPDG